MNRRVLIVAVLATLLVRLLAWGAEGRGTAYAGHPNQTIPTPTPSGLPGTPSLTRQPPTRGPTEPPIQASAFPSPVRTDQSTASVPSVTRTTAVSEPTATVVPSTGGSQTPSPAGSAVLTPEQVPASPGSSRAPELTAQPPGIPTAAPNPLGESTPVPVSSVPALTQPQASAASPTTGVGFNLLNSSCLWIALGLILIATGIVVMTRWRRSR